MKILVDINHPAHVHYFKNFIKIMEGKKHEFLIISRNKEIEHYLLDKYKIKFISRGKGSTSQFGKIFYFLKAIGFIFKRANKFKPNVIISFGTPYPAIVGWLLRIPHVSINDTEHAKMHHLLTDPFSKNILTPSCYTEDLGPKQIRFNSYMELSYLHPNYFTPDKGIFELLKINEDEKFIIMRFVSWNASHDVGHGGLSLEQKYETVRELSKYAKVFISSEGDLPQDLKKYQINIPPEKMHDALYFAILFVGEGATMASEAACLGTPAFYVNSLSLGYCTEIENKFGLLFNFRNSVGLIDKIKSVLNNYNSVEWLSKNEKLISEKIDLTSFLVSFFEKYQKRMIE